MEKSILVAASDDRYETPQILHCPCNDFQSVQSILAAIVDSELPIPTQVGNGNNHSFGRFIDWISGSYIQHGHQNQTIVHCFCGPSDSFCIYRVNASFRILNALRNTVRPYLQQHQQQGKGELFLSQSNRNDEDLPSHLSNESFPSLPSGANRPAEKSSHSKNVITTPSIIDGKKKQKRRIRPVIVSQQQTVTGNLLNLSRADVVQQQSMSLESTNSYSMEGTTNVWNRKMSTAIVLLSQTIEKESEILQSTPKKNIMSHPDIVTISSDTTFASVVTPTNKSRSNDTDKAKSVSTTTAQIKESIDELTSNKPLNFMIDMYAALINHCLVPSTIMEVHWLIRLLTISDHPPSQPTTTRDTSSDDFASILSNPNRCRYFATVSLRKQAIVLKEFGVQMLREFIRCPPFRQHLPDITEELIRDVEQSDLHSTNIHSIIGSSVLDQTVHLALPFKPERDSRHNFRSKDGPAMYKNREECRDTFLSQLRTYLHMKGKIVDSSESNRVLAKLRRSSRATIDDLFNSNVPWFAEVFVEMMLQIGHIPLQETDAELMQTVDNERLQKLHRRFTSRSPFPTNANSSHSKAIVSDPKRDVATSPIIAAQQHFTGHQEFFFLFIMYTDSYNFSVCLRTQLIVCLKNLNDSVKQTKPTEKGILDARLLARFLGAVIFSPMWRSSHEMVVNVPVVDELSQIATSGLFLSESICDGMKRGTLLFSVLWRVELLKMGKWNLALVDSPIYNQTVSGLRTLQIRLFKEVISVPAHCQEFTLIRNALDSFFYEFVGLSQAVKVENCRPEFLDVFKQPRLADSSETITSGLAVVLAPQLEDLSSLVAQLSQCDSTIFRSPGATKKLRPSVVSPAICLLQSPPVSTTATARFGPNTILSDPGTSLLSTVTTTQTLDNFQSTMRDSFFHQHGELKLVCDFVLVNILKKLRPQIVHQCIKPLITVDTPNQDHIAIIRSNITKSSMDFLSSKLEEQISAAITALAPADTPCAVLAMGIQLTIISVNRSGQALVAALVDDEITRLQQSIVGFQIKRLFPKEISEDRIEQMDRYKGLSEQIYALSSSIRSTAGNISDAHASFTSLLSYLGELTGWDSTSIPPENSVRLLYGSIQQLDDQSDVVTSWAMDESQCSVEGRWKVLAAYVVIAFKLKKISQRGLHKLIVQFNDEPFLARFIQLGVQAHVSISVSEILCQLVQAKFILSSKLHDVVQNSGVTESVMTELCLAIQSSSAHT